MNLRPILASKQHPITWMIVMVSAVIVAALYFPALHYPFISDDSVYVTGNAKLSGLHLVDLWRLFTEPYNNFEFLPLRDLSYWFDIKLFGLKPAAFRLHNIILYLLCLPLVYAITRGLWRYFRPDAAAGAPWAAAIVTTLFALHPAHVEAVVWISGRKDVLSAMFSLLALWLAVKTKCEQGFSPRYATASLAALLAAMLSKATAVAVAPVIALLWIIFWRDIPYQSRRGAQLLWPVAIMSLAACVTWIFSTMSTVQGQVYFGIEAVTRSFAVLGWMARLAVSPESRHFYYPVLDTPNLAFMVALGVAVLAASVAAGMMVIRKRSLEGFLLLAFCLFCIPYVQLIPFRTHSLVTDRFLTLAVLPAVILIVALAWRLKPLYRLAIFVAIALSWGIQTAERPHDWRNFEALVDSDIHAFPGYSLPAAYEIIFNQLPEGRYREAGETASSISMQEFRDVMTALIKADYAVHVIAMDTGNPEQAMMVLWKLEKDIKLPAQARWNAALSDLWMFIGVVYRNEWDFLTKKFPDDESVQYNAGLWLLKIGKFEDSVIHLRAATDSGRLLESARGTAFKNLGMALMGAGRIAEAEIPLRAALEQSPPDLRANCALADVYSRTGHIEEAARAQADCSSRNK